MEYSTDTLLNGEMLLVILVGLICFFILFAILINSYISFKEKRDYIKMEMERSINKDEYRTWRHELKTLYISTFPILRIFEIRKHRHKKNHKKKRKH